MLLITRLKFAPEKHTSKASYFGVAIIAATNTISITPESKKASTIDSSTLSLRLLQANLINTKDDLKPAPPLYIAALNSFILRSLGSLLEGASINSITLHTVATHITKQIENIITYDCQSRSSIRATTYINTLRIATRDIILFIKEITNFRPASLNDHIPPPFFDNRQAKLTLCALAAAPIEKLLLCEGKRLHQTPAIVFPRRRNDIY